VVSVTSDQPGDHMDALFTLIRSIPGHERFATNLNPVELHRSAVSPEDWLYLLTSTSEGVAILVSRKGVITSIALPELRRDNIQARADAFAEINPRTSQRHRDSLAWDTVEWLASELFSKLYEQLPLSDGPLIIFPGGPLAVLPLSAAYALWSRGSGRSPPCRMSLYPSAMLREASNRGRTVALGRGVAVVDSEVDTSGREVQAIASALGERELEVIDARVGATSVREHLRGSSFVHFACHGKANLSDPDKSYIQLAAQAQENLMLSDLWDLNLGTLRLAVLATCGSGLAGGALIDELLTFPTVLLRAGVGSVVATLWTVFDPITDAVGAFYTQLSKGYEPAEALYNCQMQAVLEKRRGFAEWAALACFG
jgi:hypothetical protein